MPPTIVKPTLTDHQKQLQKQERLNITAYINPKKYHLLTTRFNDITWAENEHYRQKNPMIACIYSSPEPTSQHIDHNKILFILEMNNKTNRIMGIGMVKNKPIYNKYHTYNEPIYNTYAYLGKDRIDRSDMNEKEEEIMQVFDILCFKGATHQKRLMGITSFPPDKLYRCSHIVDLVDFIAQIFINKQKKHKLL